MRPPPLPRPELLTARLARRRAQPIQKRYYSQIPQNEVAKNVGQKTPFVKEEPVDPRPKWMFSAASLLRVTLIPIGLVYAVFYHDFGEEEHVFMPPRRWLQRQKETFFTLSPAETHLVKDAEAADEQRKV